MKSTIDELVGKRFGRLVVHELMKNKKGRKVCRCVCDCGNEKIAEISNLKLGKTVSCGCRMKEINTRYANIVGKEYYDLFVELKTDKRKSGIVVWKCKCIRCGEYIEATKKQLDRGYVRDCGRHNHEELIGKKTGSLKVLHYSEENDKYYCQCSCGEFTYVSKWNLVTGKTKSCGCLKKKDNFERIDGAVPGMLESKISTRNTSGVKGVSKTKRETWVSYITLKKKRYTLGEFKNKQDAVKVRKEAEQRLFNPILEQYHTLKEN